MKNAIKKASLRSVEKISKLALSTKNVKERLKFAKMHEDWIICDWKRVNFSDET